MQPQRIGKPFATKLLCLSRNLNVEIRDQSVTLKLIEIESTWRSHLQ